MVATGITATGGREVLGVTVDVLHPEDKLYWRAFLRSLKERGLNGYHLVISDQHARSPRCVGSCEASSTNTACWMMIS